ncbi:GNAT family N-acetyltransferase [Aurantimonas endophytica]|uniref:GNAT superfamily N-acetyltransferase n=1 Tax=Aurantimonas endophytica TaxID=1522175 RepID=A0A7W6HC68_9HYPH|nr:GNAT superfamily N-acetyltransferase [Aurantimonas endophytica]
MTASDRVTDGIVEGDTRLGAPARVARPAPAATRFRAATTGDEAFFAALYASTRVEELAVTGWPEAMQAAFLAQQAAAQHVHYVRHYEDAEWWVLERNGEPVGRLILARYPSQHSIVDIALLPQARGQGLGSAILAEVIAEADNAGKPLAIHVEKANPAMRLYRRLGFATVEDKGVYDLMMRPAADRKTADAADGRVAIS